MNRRFVVALALGLAVTACGPRIYVKREQPARVVLGPEARVLNVRNGQDEPVIGIVLDPFGALARSMYTPHAVKQLEYLLSSSDRYQVLPRCGPVCPQADTLLEVAVTNVSMEGGSARDSTSKTGHASVYLRAYGRNGQLTWQGTYSDSSSGGVPGSKGEQPDNVVLTACVDQSLQDFVRDLHPQWISESFRMEDEGPLEACAKLAVAGDLDGAERVAREVLAAQPNNAKAIYNLGALFTARGQLEPALEAFRAAAALDKKYVDYARAAERRLADRGVLQQQR